MVIPNAAALSREAFPCSLQVQLSIGLRGERKSRCLVPQKQSAGHCARVRNCQCRKRAEVWRRVRVVGPRAVQRGGGTAPVAHLARAARHYVVLHSEAKGEGEEKGVRRRGGREVGSLLRVERRVLDPR